MLPNATIELKNKDPFNNKYTDDGEHMLIIYQSEEVSETKEYNNMLTLGQKLIQKLIQKLLDINYAMDEKPTTRLYIK